MSKLNNTDYQLWLKTIKSKIRSAQVKAALSVNQELILFYWELGRMITEKQAASQWGNKLIEQLAIDLKKEFSGMAGFSRTNLYAMRKFYQYFSSVNFQKEVGDIAIVQQLVGRLPWGHLSLLLSKVKATKEVLFYLQQTLENHWSRDVLALQIKTNLYERQGKALTNFDTALPSPQSDLAQQTIKDPYIFDFLTLSKPYKERDIEDQLVRHITQFLLELGKGFAFIGRQYHLEIGGSDYYLDLLFYHVILKCYVVIDLKNTRFIPEYAGKMNFYLSAVDTLLKKEGDKPTIGILLCRDKKNIEVEFALRDINKPMGVSEFQFTEVLPDDLKSSLPTIEEIEKELLEDE